MEAHWIVLILPALVALTAMIVWLAVGRSRIAVERKKAVLRASFDALRFTTPAGPVHGDALDVVKISHQFGQETPYYGGRGPAHWDAFWYAVGPGPSYFLAICMVDTSKVEVPPQWTIRQLDEIQMRAALMDDPAANALAFGGAIRA